MRSKNRGSRPGFTLIELLSVIAIIAILSAMLMPTFSRAREMARRTQCASNMKQLGMAAMFYAQDYDEKFPGALVGTVGAGQPGGWTFYSVFGTSSTPAAFDPSRGSLFNYTKSTQIYICISDIAGQRTGQSYAINACALQPPPVAGLGYAPGKSLAAFDDTAKFMLFSEEGIDVNYGLSTDDGYQLIPGNPISTRHLGGSNVAFIDGHVKFIIYNKVVDDQLYTGGHGTSCP